MTEDDLDLPTLLPSPTSPKGWDYRPVVPLPDCFIYLLVYYVHESAGACEPLHMGGGKKTT